MNDKSGEKMKAQLEALNDGTLVLVETVKGETMEVKVKQLSVLRMGNLARAAGAGELAEVCLYTGLKEADVECLKDESQVELLKEGRRLNFQKLGAFYARARELNQVITGSAEEMERLIQSAVAKASTS